MRRSRIQRTARRKFDLAQAHGNDAASITSGNADIIGGWLVNPAGLWDSVLEYQAPENSTLIATRVSYQGHMRWDGDQPGVVEAALGIIAWPTAAGIDVPLELPSPFLPYQWVYRHTEAVFMGAETSLLPEVYDWSNYNGPESLISSKAQRKLPEGVGLLLVLEKRRSTLSLDCTIFQQFDMQFWFKLS